MKADLWRHMNKCG